MTALAAQDPALRLFVTQLLGFLILALILRIFAWRHIVALFRKHQDEIRSQVDTADQQTSAVAAELDEIHGRAAALPEEARRRTSLAEKEGRAGSEELLSQAHLTSRQLSERAAREVALEREKAVYSLRADSVRWTLRAAEGLVERAMTDTIHRSLVDRFLKDLERTARP